MKDRNNNKRQQRKHEIVMQDKTDTKYANRQYT